MTQDDKLATQFLTLEKQLNKLGTQSREAEDKVQEQRAKHQPTIVKQNAHEVATLKLKVTRIDEKRDHIWNKVTQTYLTEPVRDSCWHDYVHYNRSSKYWGEQVLETNIKPMVLKCIEKYCLIGAVRDSDVRDFVQSSIEEDLEKAGYDALETELDAIKERVSQIEHDIEDKIDEKVQKVQKEADKSTWKCRKVAQKMEDIAFKLDEDETFRRNRWRMRKLVKETMKNG